MNDATAKFLHRLDESLADRSFAKLSLSAYRGAEPELQKLLVRRITVKREEKLSFTYRYKRRDIVKNHDVSLGLGQLHAWLGTDFHAATLATTQGDLQWQQQKTKATLKELPASQTETPLAHDRKKERLVAAGKPYLHALGITEAQGHVRATAQDKYRQINRYVELLAPTLEKLPEKLRVADMGAGKGYLTFALYDHLASLGKTPEVIGVEARPDLVELGNRIATQTGFTGLRFEQGTIAEFDCSGTNLLIALHACDTATDDAIAGGVLAGAQAIVVAPCCHKQVRREMERTGHEASLDFLLTHGTFMERQAEMVTDGLRALLLELHGYRTKVFEFISDAHTPKNVMITAVRGSLPREARANEIRAQIAAAKATFGIGEHYLETRLR